MFDIFFQCLIDNTGAVLTKIKYHEIKGGAKIRFEVPVKTISFKNMVGQDDENIISLNIQTGYANEHIFVETDEKLNKLAFDTALAIVN